MQKKIVLALAIVLILIGGIGFFLRSKLIPSQAGILVESNPESQVFINDESVGLTPVDINRKPGEVTIKLIPAADNKPLAPYETKVTLTGGVKTVVRRDFGPTDDESAGEIISFDPLGSREAVLSIVSIPDAAEIFLDDVSKGFAPLRIDSIGEGEHKVSLKAEGFKRRDVSLKAVNGYKLTLVVKLALDTQANPPQAKPTAGEEKQVLVEILKTPVGFLRVREEPSLSATEEARVEPGKKYPLLDTNKDGSWYKIEYEQGKDGWVSAQYAKKIEANTP